MFEAQWEEGERRTDKGMMPVRQSAQKVQHDVNDFKHVRSVSLIFLCVNHKGSERAK